MVLTISSCPHSRSPGRRPSWSRKPSRSPLRSAFAAATSSRPSSRKRGESVKTRPRLGPQSSSMRKVWLVRVLYPGTKFILFVKESTYFAIDLIVNVEIMYLLNAKSSILLSGLLAWKFPLKLWQTPGMCGGAINWQEANVSNVAVESSSGTFYLPFCPF